jgi:hypothetical protein
MRADPLVLQEQIRRDLGLTGPPITFGPPQPTRRDKFFSFIWLAVLSYAPALQRIIAALS